jgi:sugar/nucleoside kinase (ribokinase family)
MICIIGDAFIDIIVPVNKLVMNGAVDGNISVSYGGIANIAVWVSRHGVKSRFFGKVGNDPLGVSYKEDLKKEKVDAQVLIDQELPTGLCVSLVNNKSSRTMITNRGANDNLSVEEVKENLDRILTSTEILFFSGYSLISDITSKAIEYLLKKAKENEKEIWFNPGALNVISDKYIRIIKKYCDAVVLNLDEGKAMVKEKEPEKIIKVLGSWINTAVLTLGAEGCIAVDMNKYYNIPAKKVERIVDTTGAGDAFAAGCLIGKLKGYNFDRCCELGHEISSRVIQMYGAR